ncbi:MAG: type I-F CRISPR-associated endoribonuclease Cas6/Csy4 [Pseudomonadota bacterium]
MEHYIELFVLPDPEFTDAMLMSALFSKLHRYLGKNGQGKVGVSFPKATKKSLGNHLRLHGNEAQLGDIKKDTWLAGLSSFVEASEVLSVPDTVEYYCIQRVQRKTAHNKRKRVVSKGWLSEQEAQEKFPDEAEQLCKLPYVQIKSLSNSNAFKLFIQQSPQREKREGQFSSYGLSASATIPWF